ncbi:MAG: glycosyltransferase family 2 protein [Chitinophagaceae bacterium]|nr:glycosyltransferase family 2 protein [Chitinophagaceae bacterium]
MPAETPLVTVVTVAYNSSLYIRDAIESVLAQSYTHLEYIIGDDCSTDDTWKIIGEYKDPRIKAYRNETNLREYANRNKAIDMATGKYLIFIDGDDVIYQHGIQFFVSQTEQFPAAAMAIQKGYINNILYPALLHPEEIIKNDLYGSVGLLPSSFASNFYRTEILKQAGKLSTKWITGDAEVRLRIASQYPVLFVAGWVSWPRETPGQASTKIANGVGTAETYLMMKEILAVTGVKLNDSLKEDMYKQLKHKVALMVVHLLKRGKFKDISRCLKSTGLSFSEILLFLNYRSKYHDILDDHNSVKPLKRGFLNKMN